MREFKNTKLKCWVCGGILRISGVIPAAHIYPELRTYQCDNCGSMRTVEGESQLAGITPSEVQVNVPLKAAPERGGQRASVLEPKSD